MDLTVRPAVRHDARAIAGVHVRGWQSGYRGLLADELLDGLSVEGRARDWDGWLRDDDGPLRTIVAVEADAIIGFCSLTAPHAIDAATHTAEIVALYVEPAHWRRGVGVALMSRALDLLRRDGSVAATLWVFDGNARGRSFYATFGFAPDGASKRDEDGPMELENGPAQVRLSVQLKAYTAT